MKVNVITPMYRPFGKVKENKKNRSWKSLEKYIEVKSKVNIIQRTISIIVILTPTIKAKRKSEVKIEIK